jgi:hypothetical protein
MDNPYIGSCKGVFVVRRVQRMPPDENLEELPWIRQMWYWTRQDIEKAMGGSCGSIVTDEQGRAVSFFRFVDPRRFALGVVATQVTRFGYEVSR